MTNYIHYEGLDPSLHKENPALVQKIKDAIANSTVSADVEYGRIFQEDDDNDFSDDYGYWGIKHLPSGEEMAIFYDDEAMVDDDIPSWQGLINDIFDIMDAYMLSEGWGPVRL